MTAFEEEIEQLKEAPRSFQGLLILGLHLLRMWSMRGGRLLMLMPKTSPLAAGSPLSSARARAWPHTPQLRGSCSRSAQALASLAL